MKSFQITIDVIELGSEEELNPEEKKLLAEAKKSTGSAYAPYSKFFVGAALLLENGEIVCGSNQENAASPSGLCAERVGIFAAGAHFPGVAVKTIAITAKSQKFIVNQPVSPCGDCRQVMLEYEERYKKNIRVILAGETGKVFILESIKALLPLRFTAESLIKK